MSTGALLVTKQATIAPAGLIGPSWAELREALAESDSLRKRGERLAAQLDSERAGRRDAEHRIQRLEREIGVLEFHQANSDDSSASLKRQNARMAKLLEVALEQAERATAAVQLAPGQMPRRPTPQSLRSARARARADAHEPTLSRVDLRGGVWFDVPSRTLREADRFRSLSPSEYLLLLVLAERRGKRTTMDDIGVQAFGLERGSQESKNVVRVRVATLRNKLAEFGVRDLIPADRTQGYVLLSVPS